MEHSNFTACNLSIGLNYSNIPCYNVEFQPFSTFSVLGVKGHVKYATEE